MEVGWVGVFGRKQINGVIVHITEQGFPFTLSGQRFEKVFAFILHRAITDREMIGLVSEIKPELVVYEYCDGDNIESIKTTLDGLAIPLVLISDQEYTDKKVYSKDNLNEILEKGYKEYAINQEESLVSEEVGDTPLIDEPNQSSSTVNFYKEQICIQLEQENDLLKEEKKEGHT